MILPYYENGRGKVFCCNCVDVMKEMPPEHIDLTVTSPPYDDLRTYEGYEFSFEQIADELYRVTKQGGVVVWVIGDKVKNGGKSLTSFRQALYFQQIGFSMYDVIIYEKAGSGPPHKNRYFNSFEYMFVLSKGTPKTINLLQDKPNKWAGTSTFGHVTRREADGSLTDKGVKTVQEFGVRTNVWRYINGKGFSTKDTIAYQHPAIFPEKLALDHILSWSAPGDIVFDPMCGSGTTAKVAMQNGRNFVVSEISEKYCEITKARLEAVTQQEVK